MSATLLTYDEDEDYILITVSAVTSEEEAPPDPSSSAPIPIADIISQIEDWSGGDATVTLGHLVLGSQHATTGHYTVSYDESEIEMAIFPASAMKVYIPLGLFSRYNLIGFTGDYVDEGDYVVDVLNRKYVVQTVEPWLVLDQFYYYFCGLERVLS